MEKMRLHWTVTMAASLAIAGCGVVTVGGKPVGEEPQGGDAQPEKTSEAGSKRQASWEGRWGSQFGVVEFTQKGTKVSGTYPGGSLECDAPGIDLLCTWKDNTGSGKAKFQWGSEKAAGTFGNGQSDSDQGEWSLTWPAPGSESSSASDSVIALTLKNDCKQDFSFCVETGSGKFVQKSKVGKQSQTRYDVVPGAKVWARSGSGMNDGSCTTLLGEIDGSPGSSSSFVLCK